MSSMRGPAVGERYISPEGQIFEVIAVDDVGEAVELQYEDGSVEAVDLDEWFRMRPRSVDAADDWGDTFDALNDDSY